MEKRVISTDLMEEDYKIENSLRPKFLKDYIGQSKAKENLKIYIEAAKQRNESLDHVLLYGPPGLGKTTLAGIIANEMDVNLKITSGPAIEKPGEMASILNNLSMVIYCLWMRFTDLTDKWKKCSIRQWKIMSLIL